jgi:hypothetical protein
MSGPTIGDRQVQPTFPKLGPGETVAVTTQIAKATQAEHILCQTHLQNGDPIVFKEADQQALDAQESTSSTKGVLPQETAVNGDSTDDPSTSIHSTEFRKRKDDEQKENEVLLSYHFTYIHSFSFFEVI